ncbi:MAG: SH3 domain-containing protein [Caldilinea sp.]|nr:SH3 domain-containing protein [Caldilinea sp.]
MMSRLFTRRSASLAILLLLAALLLSALPAASVIAAPAAQESSNGFLVFGGTVVNAPRLNVRDAPTTNGRILGKLPAGTRVAVVGRSGNWFLIRFPAAPVGLAWTNSSYIQLDGQRAPVVAQPTPAPQRTVAVPPPAPQASVPSLPDIQVDPPNLVDFNNGTFRWQWYGDMGKLDGVDWYTDILLFNKGETMPYRTFVAEPGQVGQDGPFFVWGNEQFRVQCNTEAVARIAVRANGQYIGWVSGPSAPIDVGPKCSSGGGGGSSSGGGGGNGGGSDPGVVIPPDDLIDCSNPDFADLPQCQN